MVIKVIVTTTLIIHENNIPIAIYPIISMNHLNLKDRGIEPLEIYRETSLPEEST